MCKLKADYFEDEIVIRVKRKAFNNTNPIEFFTSVNKNLGRKVSISEEDEIRSILMAMSKDDLKIVKSKRFLVHDEGYECIEG